MTILHISHTHSQHHTLHPLPKADVIVHSGDFTFAGSEDEASVMDNAYNKINAPRIIII